MKRIVVTVGLVTLLAAPAAAQLMGLPVWNSPKGGTGVTINGDLGLPNETAGKGTAFGGRASLGIANLTLSAGVASWTPDNPLVATEGITSMGGTAAFRVIGGSLLPVAFNLLVGGAKQTGGRDATTVLVGAGFSAALPTPGLSIEPYVTVSNRWLVVSGSSDSNFGVTFGANANFGMMGVHLAYDTVSEGSSSSSIFGIGAHVSIKAPI